MKLFNIKTSLTLEADSAGDEKETKIQIVTEKIAPFLNEHGDFVVEYSEKSSVVKFFAGEKRNADSYRSLGGKIAAWLKKSEMKSAALLLPDALTADDRSSLFEGLLLGAFSFEKYRKGPSEAHCTLHIDSAECKRLARAEIICGAVNMARDWAHEPACVINPWTLSERAEKLAKKYNLKCRILDDQELKEMGAGAIVAVGQGSKTPSRMIVLEYAGTKKVDPVVLVGKAITFDSGGYSLKPSDAIVGMKYDKCGAMAVLGAIRAAAELKVAPPVVGIICAAENRIDDKAYLPDDIIISLSGLSIEIISTDAEGRLVLADGLTYAQKEYKPRAIVDLATLTGGCVVAYGHVRAGVVDNNTELFNALFDSGEKTWERIWRLPHDEDYAKLIKSKDADIKNSGGRWGSPITGGIFLKQFVSDDVPWAHIDIAGTADCKDAMDYSVPGATGFGIRLLVDWLEGLD